MYLERPPQGLSTVVSALVLAHPHTGQCTPT
jgi:hypothetical protein